MASAGHEAVANDERLRLERAAYAAGRLAGRLDVATRRLPWPRRRVALALLILANWGVIAEAARIAAHRGWLYEDGGAGSWYYTSAWVLAHGHIPQATIGYGYSLLTAPLALIAGPNLAAGAPLILLLNAFLLSPLALLCIYALAKGLGGVRVALGAALLWVVLPLAAIRYFLPDYHSRYVDITLPTALGLTNLGEFPSMVCLLVAAVFSYRALQSRAPLEALAAGLAAGLALGVKPSNVLFLPAPLLALALARRPRELALFAVGLAPSLLALALWKFKGLGDLPLFSAAAALGHARVLAAAHAALPTGSVGLHLGRYLNFSWATFKLNLDGLREFGWSKRLVEWLAFAGLAGVARRSLSGAVLLGVWLASYLVVVGGDEPISIYGGNFFTHLVAAFPAFVLLCVGTVFLIPIYGRRRPSRAQTETWPRSPRARRGVVAALAFLAVLPIGVFALLPPLDSAAAADMRAYNVYIPTNQFPLSAQLTAAGVRISWRAQPADGTQASYIVFRARNDVLACAPRAHAATRCQVESAASRVLAAGSGSFLDRPAPGRWSYRVALAAAGAGPASGAEPLLLSSAVTVTVPR